MCDVFHTKSLVSVVQWLVHHKVVGIAPLPMLCLSNLLMYGIVWCSECSVV